ncbi:MAG: NAD(+) diphosphatase [Paracoccaceae bacterium]|nr:MAG: NAD(+) diphosphatase [Paracoccaceae bacterium]
MASGAGTGREDRVDGFAFGTSGLDRAAQLRGDPEALAARLADGRILPIWRGKPLIDRSTGLGWLEAGHPALTQGGPPVFLGLDEGVARFAQDISDWSPEAGAEAVQAGFFDASEQHHPALPPEQVFAELRGMMLRLTPREGELAATAKAVLGWHRSHGFCAVCGARSEPVQGGWQRRCTACGANHFPRTDPVVIMLVIHGNRALMGRSPGWPQGMYSCLAGFVEPGETIEAAVRREVVEETGVTIGRVRYAASQPWPFPASLMIGCVAQALTETLTPDPAEIEDARWIGREEMVEVMAGRHSDVRPARRGAIAHALISAWLADRLD